MGKRIFVKGVTALTVIIAIAAITACSNMRSLDLDAFKNGLNAPDVYFKYKPILKEFNRVTRDNMSFIYDCDRDLYYSDDFSVCYVVSTNELQFMVKSGKRYEKRIYSVSTMAKSEDDAYLDYFMYSGESAYSEKKGGIGPRLEIFSSGLSFNYPTEGKIVSCQASKRANCNANKGLSNIRNMYSIHVNDFDTKRQTGILLYSAKNFSLIQIFKTSISDDTESTTIENPNVFLIRGFYNTFRSCNAEKAEAFCTST
ncbi:MAG: hypothetical protein FWG42_10615, partial [Clostridiales bacterium]|nr:hypothetical protein [Clostridiales bacterium]